MIELMVAVAVLAILAMVAVPSFSDAILSNKLASYANRFVGSAMLARGEAIKRNADVTLCRSSDGATCAAAGGWEQGWVVLTGATVIQFEPALSVDYRLTGDVNSIVFQSIGSGATPATLKLCRATPSPGRQERQIRVSATGRTSVSVINTAICP